MEDKSRPCPECRKNNHDKTGDHLFLMGDGVTYYCNHSSYHTDGKPYREVAGISLPPDEGDTTTTGTLEDLVKVVQTVPKDTPVKPIPTGFSPVDKVYRGLEPDTYKRFGMLAEYTPQGDISKLKHTIYKPDGNPLVDKCRDCITKDFWTTGKTSGVPMKMFGQQQFPSGKRLLIVEGELDALSAWQMLKKYRVVVWSVPTGAHTKAIIENMDSISKFTKGNKELFFCMDNDPAGNKLSSELASLFPEGKQLDLASCKDANEMLTSGKSSQFVDAFWSAEIYRPESIVKISDILQDILKRPVVGRDWPWPTLTKATYGRRGGEGIFVGAGVKIGKSEFINELIAFDCKNGDGIASIKFEEPPAQTAKRVAGKIDGIFYHKPTTVYKDEDLEHTVLGFQDKLLLHRAFGKASWDTCKDFIRYAVACGCKTIIIDPITKITNGLTPSETETELRRFSDELACMAQDMDFFYIVTCHLKAPSSGLPHERGGKVETYQFRGSRSMAENCYYFLGIERNKDPDLEEDERNTSTFVLLDDRAFGNSCRFPVFYDRTNQSYLEPTGGIF